MQKLQELIMGKRSGTLASANANQSKVGQSGNGMVEVTARAHGPSLPAQSEGSKKDALVGWVVAVDGSRSKGPAMPRKLIEDGLAKSADDLRCYPDQGQQLSETQRAGKFASIEGLNFKSNHHSPDWGFSPSSESWRNC